MFSDSISSSDRSLVSLYLARKNKNCKVSKVLDTIVSEVVRIQAMVTPRVVLVLPSEEGTSGTGLARLGNHAC